MTLADESRSYDLVVQPRIDGGGVMIGVSGVAVDITDRKRTEQLLRDSEARLREADRRKDEFLAMLAHELRNPLAPIRSGLQLLRLRADTPGAVTEVRAMLERQVGYMVRLIDDLLDVSRISSGKINLQRQPTSLAGLVSGAVEANRGAMEQGEIALSVRIPQPPPTLDVDATRFVQVLSNLLHNAVKFTDPGGRIAISAEIVDSADGAHGLVLSVADTGRGIAPEVLPRIFELFTQGERDHHSAHGGLGIGLALARRIVEMHGGRIDARSEGHRRGSEFVIRMPLVEPTSGPDDTRPAVERRVLNRRVLIIDDNDDAAGMLAAIVRTMGGVAVTANNAVSGIERAGDFAPDIIPLDIGMSEMDGYEACRRIRRQPAGRTVMIVAVTGWGQERDKQLATEAGFDAHVTKPVDPYSLERLLFSAP